MGRCQVDIKVINFSRRMLPLPPRPALTGAGVGSEAPGEGAHGSRVPGLPQVLQLGKLAGRADEGTQILFAGQT